MRESTISDYLERKMHSCKVKLFIVTVITAFLFVSAASLPNINDIFKIAAMVLFLSVGLIIIKSMLNNEYFRIRSGMCGESIFKAVARNVLNDDYVAIYNIPIGCGDIDSCVIGPTGLYLFEIKNYTGEITEKNGELYRIKKDRWGVEHDAEQFSPVRQMSRNIGKLKPYLLNYGINIWIEGIIVFTEPTVVLNVSEVKHFKVIKVDSLRHIFEGKRKMLSPGHVDDLKNIIMSSSKTIPPKTT